jgi:hypothetical protein
MDAILCADKVLRSGVVGAEEYGVTSANADSMKTSDNPQIKRLVGAEGEMGAAFGLDNEWNLRIIKQGEFAEETPKKIRKKTSRTLEFVKVGVKSKRLLKISLKSWKI